MKTETQVLRTFDRARKEALKPIVAEAKRVLPDGWAIWLAVGWGFTVYDDKREVIMANETVPPARLPRGVRPLLKAAASFYDLFSPGNEVITSKGLRK